MEPWTYTPAADLNDSLRQRLRRFPREPDMLAHAIRGSAALAMRGWLKAYHRLKIVGKENIPHGRSCILVANHGSHLDALCLLSALPLRQVHRTFPAAAADYFFVSPHRLAVAVLLINALPFERETHVRQSLALCRQLLQTPGNVLIIFPEGTRSSDGEIGAFKPGIGLLAAGQDVPVIPCHLHGARRAMPKGSRFPRPHPIRLTIGHPRSYADVTPTREAVMQICHELREAVVQLGPGG